MASLWLPSSCSQSSGFWPGPLVGAVYEAAPDNAQILLDPKNKTWFSPPCVFAGTIERATQQRIEAYTDDDILLTGRREWTPRHLIDAGVFERATVAEAHKLRKVDPNWHPDDPCNAAGGLLQETTLWGWITNRPSQWTPDGQ